MNYLITGFPGTGKSTIAKALKNRGHRAYDPQAMHSYMHIESRATGSHMHAPESVPHGWYDTVAGFNWNLAKVERLLQSTEDIFICSMAHNQHELYDQFDKIFVLTLDTMDLIDRLNSRWGNTIGKSPDELADILALHESFEQSLLNRGAVRVNVARPINEVVDKILAKI